MADLRRVPPGRAGRLWLLHHQHIAERGVELLDRKLRILRGEQQRFQQVEKRARERWEHAAAEARTWLVRAAVLGGQRELRFATPPGLAQADVTWAGVMGVSYPAAVRCKLPEPAPGARVPASAAMGRAIIAHGAAVRAAAELAIASAACGVIDAEVVEVRRRVTALTKRWLPRLAAARHELEARLEEVERSETARLHAFLRLSGKEDR